MANEMFLRTIDFDVSRLTQSQRDHLAKMSKAELASHKSKIAEQHAKEVPLGPYPWKTKTSGWVKAWFTEDAQLEYRYQNWGKGLTVSVEVSKASGTVSVLCRSEVFDDATGTLQLQEDPWRQQITVARAKDIIRNNSANWPKYVEYMQTYGNVNEDSFVRTHDPTV